MADRAGHNQATHEAGQTGWEGGTVSVTREARQALHAEWADAMAATKDYITTYRQYLEEQLIGATAMIGLLDDEIKALKAELAAAKREIEGGR